MTGGGGDRREAHFVQSLERGLAVIRAFDGQRPEMTLSEVARECALTRAAARRFLLTLVDLGYVRTDGRMFRLGPRVLELGYAYLSGSSLPRLATPHLEHLMAEVRESVAVSVLDGDDIVSVARVPSRRIMTVAVNVGARFPAHPTAAGRVLLAWAPPELVDGYLARTETARTETARTEIARTETARTELTRSTSRTLTTAASLRTALAKVRRQGYAIVDQELEDGLRSVAAPLRDGTGRVVAGLGISTHAGRTSMAAARRDLLPPLLATAAAIEADLRLIPPTVAG